MTEQGNATDHPVGEPNQSHLPIVEIGQVGLGQCLWTFGLLWMSPSTVSGVAAESRIEADLTGADVYGVARYETRAQYALGKLPTGQHLPKKRIHLAGAFIAAQVTAQTGIDNWIGAIRISIKLPDQATTSFWWLVEVQNGELVPKGDQISDDEHEVRETLIRRTSRVSFRAVYCPVDWHLPGEEVLDQAIIARLLDVAVPPAKSAFRLYSRGGSTLAGLPTDLGLKISRLDSRQKLLLVICCILGLVAALELFTGGPDAVLPRDAQDQPSPQANPEVQAIPMEVAPPPPRPDPVAGSAEPQKAFGACWRAMSEAPAYLAGAPRRSLTCRIELGAALLIAQFERSQHPDHLVSALASKRGFDGQDAASGAWTQQVAGAGDLGLRVRGRAAALSDPDPPGWARTGDPSSVDGYKRTALRSTVSVPIGTIPNISWPGGFVLRQVTRQAGSASSITLEIEGDRYVDTVH